MTPEAIISAFRLEPHPEGGWFREIHRSARPPAVLPGYDGPRVLLTAIYFLLTRETFSAFHALRSEEIWVHLAGDPLELFLLGKETGRLRLSATGGGGNPLIAVPAGALQAARTLGDFTFTACLVAPGFEFEDFSLLSRKSLLEAYPEHEAVILSLTR